MNNIIQSLESDGCFGGSVFVQMLIITTKKHRKAAYYTHKAKVLNTIETIYHDHKGVDGYRSMRTYLGRKGYCYSLPTVHKYMNSELGLKSIVRRKKNCYAHEKPHKIFENKLKQDFHADSRNQKWCTDFTCLFLKNGDIRYNCSIIDLYDRKGIYRLL